MVPAESAGDREPETLASDAAAVFVAADRSLAALLSFQAVHSFHCASVQAGSSTELMPEPLP